jgi:[ribosomal protein S5]-alanine N-acetyltransferase
MEYSLRSWHVTDAQSLLENANNFKIAQYLTNKFPYPYTIDAAYNFIAFATKDTPIHIFAIEVNGKAIGGIGLHPQDDIMCKNMELGYWIGEPFWGNGIITKAIAEIVKWGFSNYDINRIFATCFSTNIASQKVLLKNGFVLEATIPQSIFKNNAMYDALIFGYRNH